MLTQHLGNMTHWQAIPGWGLNNIDHHNLTRLGFKQSICGNQNILADTGVVRAHKTDTTLQEIAPNQLCGLALNHIHKAAIGPAAPIPSRYPHQHDIAIKDTTHLGAGEVNILTLTEQR